MAIENEKLMHECFPKHLCMGTSRTKEKIDTEEEDNDTEEEGKQKSKYGKKQSRYKITMSQLPSYSSGLTSPGDRYAPKQWMNPQTNQYL